MKRKTPTNNRYFIYHLKDEYGNLIDYVTCEKKLQKLIDKHATVIGHLMKSGFTPLKTTPYNYSKGKQTINGKNCPKCGKDVSDNRKDKEEGKVNPKYPDFSCTDREECNWAVWPKQYDLEGEKKEPLKIKEPEPEGWIESTGSDLPF